MEQSEVEKKQAQMPEKTEQSPSEKTVLPTAFSLGDITAIRQALRESEQEAESGSEPTVVRKTVDGRAEDIKVSGSKEGAPLHEEEEPPYKRGIGCFGSLMYVFLIFAVSLVISYAIIVLGNDMFALVKGDEEITVNIPEGATDRQIADILENEGVIRYAWFFDFYTQVRNNSGKYESGDFELNPSMNYVEIMTKLKRINNSMETIRLTFPEGYTTDDIIEVFLANGMGTKEGFVKAINEAKYDYDFVKALDENPKEGRTYRLDGYLFPDTYDFYKNESEESIIKRFLANFNRKFSASLRARCQELNMTVDEVLTVASLVQQEAALISEFETVSSVFHNRLTSASFKKLESCATVLYAMDTRKAVLSWEDTKFDSPYNTYLHEGLTPGPIANPGLDAIFAALYPADTEYYYFVATGDGGSLFAKTRKEHLSNIEKAGSVKGTGSGAWSEE